MYYAICGFEGCNHILFSHKQTHYTKAENHLAKHYDEDAICKLIDSSSTGSTRKQADLLNTFQLKTGEQDNSLHTAITVVCKHNLPITMACSPDFRHFLTHKEYSYTTVVDTMVSLSIIVEEKLSKEMTGVKGTIMYDGWSKFSTHYVALLASYLRPTKKQSNEGHAQMEMVTRLLTCTTLPYSVGE